MSKCGAHPSGAGFSAPDEEGGGRRVTPG